MRNIRKHCDLNFTDPKDNNMTNMTETEEIVPKKFIVYKINLFLVTVPCLLLFVFVFASYVSIRQQLKLHGWTLMSITGSVALRFGVLFLPEWGFFTFDETLGSMGRGFALRLVRILQMKLFLGK